MLKFKVGDVLVSKDREEDIIEVVKTSDDKMDKMEAYGVLALEGSCVGDIWYDGHYMWSQDTIEECYKLKKIDLKFNIGDKIGLNGTHGIVDEITDVDETNEVFAYELASNSNYYWTRASIEDHYELIQEQEEKEENEFENLRKKYVTLSKKRADIHEELLTLNVDLDDVTRQCEEVERQWKKMLY